ncbi:hypothetical protein GYA54_03215 [Candidatus Kuenenbacteria bacterium]|nr:hypothetical protein [Candidatus Kuenenbacteria bacterium]
MTRVLVRQVTDAEDLARVGQLLATFPHRDGFFNPEAGHKIVEFGKRKTGRKAVRKLREARINFKTISTN